MQFFGSHAGRCLPSPADHTYAVYLTGLNCWVFTHILFFLGAYYFEWFKPTIIYDNWPQITWAMHTYGFLLAFFSFAKGKRCGAHPFLHPAIRYCIVSGWFS